MLESIVKRPDKLNFARTCSLRSHINRYLVRLLSLGYQKNTVKGFAYMLLNFASFVDKQEQYNIRDLSDWIEPFLKPVKKLYYQRKKRNIIRPFVRFLQEEGVVYKPTIKKAPEQYVNLFRILNREIRYQTIFRNQ